MLRSTDYTDLYGTHFEEDSKIKNWQNILNYFSSDYEDEDLEIPFSLARRIEYSRRIYEEGMEILLQMFDHLRAIDLWDTLGWTSVSGVESLIKSVNFDGKHEDVLEILENMDIFHQKVSEFDRNNLLFTVFGEILVEFFLQIQSIDDDNFSFYYLESLLKAAIEERKMFLVSCDGYAD